MLWYRWWWGHCMRPWSSSGCVEQCCWWAQGSHCDISWPRGTLVRHAWMPRSYKRCAAHQSSDFNVPVWPWPSIFLSENRTSVTSAIEGSTIFRSGLLARTGQVGRTAHCAILPRPQFPSGFTFRPHLHPSVISYQLKQLHAQSISLNYLQLYFCTSPKCCILGGLFWASRVYR